MSIFDDNNEKANSSYNSNNTWSNITENATYGAALGSIFPGVGTLVGAVSGGLYGAAEGIIGNLWGDDMSEDATVLRHHRKAHENGIDPLDGSFVERSAAAPEDEQDLMMRQEEEAYARRLDEWISGGGRGEKPAPVKSWREIGEEYNESQKWAPPRPPQTE